MSKAKIHCDECNWEGVATDFPTEQSITETICPQCGKSFLKYLPTKSILDPLVFEWSTDDCIVAKAIEEIVAEFDEKY